MQKQKIGMPKRHFNSIILLLLLLSVSLLSCSENKFPVSDLPEQFEFIPPDDVSMLIAQGGDGQITLVWSTSTNNDLKAIHVTNQNTGEKQILPGDAHEVTFSGLTNYEKYTFVIHTENQYDQLSYGVAISAKPFILDDVKPGKVLNLIGYKLSANMAFAVWDSPADIDIKAYVVTLGNASVTVNEDTRYAAIEGDLNEKLKVQAIDYSDNMSEPVETVANADVVSIEGYDDGTVEYIRIHKDPIITAVDGYRITYFDQKYESNESPLPETFTQTMPVDNNQPLWLDGAKTQGSWLTPVTITLLSGGKEISSFEYLTYNNIPGTLMLTHASILNEEGVNVKRNNDGTSFNSNLGNFTGDGKLPIYGIYDINVLEDGEYATTMWFSFSSNNTYKISIDDGPAIEGKTQGGTDNWDNYVEAPGPTLSLTKGKHQLRVEFPTGGNNFKKLIFTKK